MNYVTAIVRNTSHLVAEPLLLTTHEAGVDDSAVPGNEHRFRSTRVEHPIKRRRPGLQVRVPVEGGIAGLLDEVAAENDRSLGVHDDDQVVTSVPGTWMADRRSDAAEIDVCSADRIVGRPKRRNSVRHLGGIGPVTDRLGTQMFTSIRNGRRDIRCAVHGRAPKSRRAENVVEMVVRQHDIADFTVGDVRDVGLDRAASVNVVPVSISSMPVAPCTRPIVTSRNGRRQR